MRGRITFAQQTRSHTANGLNLARQDTMRRTLGHLKAQTRTDTDKVLCIRSKTQAIDHRKFGFVIDKQKTRSIEATGRLRMQRRGDLGRRPQIDITGAQLLEGKLAGGANDDVRA